VSGRIASELFVLAPLEVARRGVGAAEGPLRPALELLGQLGIGLMLDELEPT
jgi:hypothetical protein